MHLKRTLAFVLALCLMLALAPAASAAGDAADEAAGALYEMGLFQGTSVNADGTPVFDLDRAPTRAEAVTMLVRLLGGEGAALAGDWDMPFTDVPAWAEPYVGYAYSRGLAAGTGETAFGSGDSVTASQYLTFVLRALGYESGTDFEWVAAWELSDEIGLTSGQYGASTTSFTRGDVALISYTALGCEVKGGGTPLVDTLVWMEAFEFEDVGVFYFPEYTVIYSDFLDYSDDEAAFYVESESYAMLGMYSDFEGLDVPGNLEELIQEALIDMDIMPGQGFVMAEDAYGNLAAQGVIEGMYCYYVAMVQETSVCVTVYVCYEEDAAEYNFGYWASMTELY